MLAEERRKSIAEEVETKGSVEVSNLSKKFGVTRETIRRDLEKLEKQGVLQRTHGGAVNSGREKEELDFDLRKKRKTEAKKKIAEKAFRYIDPNDTIFMDGSSTCFFLARLIQNSNYGDLTVITNSASTCTELAKNKDISVICSGGLIRNHNYTMVGPKARSIISDYNASKFFASCTGITAQNGATEANDLEIEIKREMADRSDKVFLLADHSKFSFIGLSTFLTVDSIDTIITDNIDHENVHGEFGSRDIII
ncbi:DeoR/GlpR family DNA-binding transcription regulator [Halarsenatibacter silvermanii]|uniref:DNA-binding transcriptional regulator of sugar metabolism, DeoR/GlpR family n=1 Tax=Halarsenatibacter silvermanii TaxID=321763 RepID=A0A1G9LYC6_9FIRM|nr:DeoR/GlpR family DNA-binding transcription regulator [Halarsenatibacter silvermanii]SDL66913.1 DNA-binding transcriptional regulator of sugar metabolism, DeoR/GlpR family [Halarsenatibacter silvermanii]